MRWRLSFTARAFFTSAAGRFRSLGPRAVDALALVLITAGLIALNLVAPSLVTFAVPAGFAFAQCFALTLDLAFALGTLACSRQALRSS